MRKSLIRSTKGNQLSNTVFHHGKTYSQPTVFLYILVYTKQHTSFPEVGYLWQINELQMLCCKNSVKRKIRQSLNRIKA